MISIHKSKTFLLFVLYNEENNDSNCELTSLKTLTKNAK